MNQDSGELLNLNSNSQDRTVSLLKGIAGLIPYAGGIISELIDELIPNQRLDRITVFLQLLDKRIAHLEKKFIEEQLHEKENIDLFEDACFQAVRALSDERLEYIANAFSNSLTQQEVEYLFKKKIMWLLSELNDNEVIILRSYYSPSYTEEGKKFWEKHKAIVQTPIVTFSSSEEEQNEAIFKRSFRERLVQLELIRPRYKKPKRGESPEFDFKTGRIKYSGYEITQLGKMLIRFINEELAGKKE